MFLNLKRNEKCSVSLLHWMSARARHAWKFQLPVVFTHLFDSLSSRTELEWFAKICTFDFKMNGFYVRAYFKRFSYGKHHKWIETIKVYANSTLQKWTNERTKEKCVRHCIDCGYFDWVLDKRIHSHTRMYTNVKSPFSATHVSMYVQYKREEEEQKRR